MVASLPSRIMNYSVTSSSPTDELLTLGQIFSEVGGYASTVLDREHLLMSRKCSTRLRKVVGELVSRRCIKSEENLYDMPLSEPLGSDLRFLTIDELHALYRRWPIRHKERQAAGRESFSFSREGRIVQELKRRKPVNRAEQLKIDYCVTTYRNEVDNMSAVFSLPVRTEGGKILPDCGRRYTPEELTALIRLYKDYRDIAGREALVEYVDLALDLLEDDGEAISCLSLLSEVAELGRRRIIRIPEWVGGKLDYTVRLALALKTGDDADLPMALLTLHIINKDRSLERKAQRIINRCYKSAMDGEADLGKRIESLHTAVTCCDYVSRFSVCKSAATWNELGSQALSQDKELTPMQTFRLLEIAKECEDYANISMETKDRLKEMLSDIARPECPEAIALNEMAKMRF